MAGNLGRIVLCAAVAVKTFALIHFTGRLVALRMRAELKLSCPVCIERKCLVVQEAVAIIFSPTERRVEAAGSQTSSTAQNTKVALDLRTYQRSDVHAFWHPESMTHHGQHIHTQRKRKDSCRTDHTRSTRGRIVLRAVPRRGS